MKDFFEYDESEELIQFEPEAEDHAEEPPKPQYEEKWETASPQEKEEPDMKFAASKETWKAPPKKEPEEDPVPIKERFSGLSWTTKAILVAFVVVGIVIFTFGRAGSAFGSTTMLFHPLVIVILIAAALVITLIIGMLMDQNKKEAERMKIKKSINDTYGSANWATDAEISDVLAFEPIDHPHGTIFGHREIHMEDLDSVKPFAVSGDKAVVKFHRIGSNENVIVLASSDSGKSYSYAMPNLIECAEAGISVIVTDPSGELFASTMELYKSMGYNIRVLNLNNLSCSNGWNPLDVLIGTDMMSASEKAIMLTHTILVNTKDESAKGEQFFEEGAEALLRALILYVAVSPRFAGRENERHLGTVHDLLRKFSADGALPELTNLPMSDPAKVAWDTFLAGGERITRSFLQGVLNKLSLFENDLLKEVFSHSEINFNELSEEKTIIYVISSVMNSTYKFLLSLFFSCALEQLITTAENQQNRKLKRSVHFLMDEFASIGKVYDFEKKLANVRKYGVYISIIAQDISQIQKMFPDNWNSILSNCPAWLFLGVNDLETAQLVSDRMGETTAVDVTRSVTVYPFNIGAKFLSQQNVMTKDAKTMLQTPSEVIRYFNRKKGFRAILIMQSQQPYSMMSYPYTLHRRGKFCMDHQAHQKDFIPPWQSEPKNVLDDAKRTFLPKDGPTMLAGIATRDPSGKLGKERHDEQTEEKPKGIVFNTEGRSSNLIDIASLDL